MSATREQLVISGPPGIGKSAVASLLAERLGGRAVDLDREIEDQHEASPARLIRERGEAKFRDIEATTLASLDTDARVIALGGGTLTTPNARRLARAKGPIVGLVADADAIADRLVGSDEERPLLDGQSLDDLMSSRARSYAAVDRVVSAAGSPSAVCEEVLNATRELKVLEAEVGQKKTRVVVGRDLAEACSGAVDALSPTRPVLVIEDEGVPGEARDAYLRNIEAHFDVRRIALPGGEEVKAWGVLEHVTEDALTHGCGRQSVVIGLGGGAVTDLAGLVASLLGRGAPLVLVPTTLLAQVDASVGGKCAINSASGRNLLGAFHPATDVIVDLDFLATLDPRDVRSGMAELLKMGVIQDADLFRRVVEERGPKIETVARAIELKADLVAQDPFEKLGPRKLLNFGHTLAHALESASNYTLRHGEAVGIGMAAATRLSAARGGLQSADQKTILEGIEAVGLATHAAPELLERCAPFLNLDKKADAKEIDLIFVQKLGKAVVTRVELSQIKRDLVRLGGQSQ